LTLFAIAAKSLTLFFLLRGYPLYLLIDAIDGVSKQSRESLLLKSRLDQVVKSDNRIPFVLTFHPSLVQFLNRFKQIVKYFSNDPTFSNIFQTMPLVSFRRSPNLADTFIRAAAPFQASIPVVITSQYGTFPCNAGRCMTCKVISNSSSFSSNNYTFKIKKVFNCDTEAPIYLINCNKRSKIHIGETGRKLKDRAREHIRSVRLANQAHPIGVHFSLPDHTINDLTISLLMQCHDINRRKILESLLIKRFRSMTP
jgi:hypothetical protein